MIDDFRGVIHGGIPPIILSLNQREPGVQLDIVTLFPKLAEFGE